MNHRKARQLRRKLKNTPLHESRSALRSKTQVENFAKKFASGLGELLPYEIMDKYYRPEKYVSRDALTELGDFNGLHKHKGLWILIAVAIVYMLTKS